MVCGAATWRFQFAKFPGHPLPLPTTHGMLRYGWPGGGEGGRGIFTEKDARDGTDSMRPKTVRPQNPVAQPQNPVAMEAQTPIIPHRAGRG